MKSKVPSFNFYPDNFMGGTVFFSDAEVGYYIRLLSLLFQAGGKLERKKIEYLLRGKIPDIVLEKLSFEGDLVFHHRLLSEMTKTENIQKRNQENGKKGGRPSKNKPKLKPKINPNYNPKTNRKKTLSDNDNDNEILTVENEKGGIVKGGDLPLDEVIESVSNDPWLEVVVMQTHLKQNQVLEKLQEFISKLKMDEVKNIEISEFKRYFNNWIKYQLKNGTTNKRKSTRKSLDPNKLMEAAIKEQQKRDNQRKQSAAN